MMAKAPYSDPLRSPAQKAEAKKKTFFGRLTQLFQPKEREDMPREDLLLEQDEKLSTTHDAIHHDDVKVASTSPVQPKTYWPITSLDRTQSPPLPPAQRPDVLTRTSLSGVSLTLGESVALVNTFPPGKDGLDPNNECVKKNRSTTFFCIAPVDWPEDLRPSFIVATILYTGPMSIARFDQGEANRFHALFNSADFDRVVNFYQKRYGEPTEIWRRSIAPLAKPRQDNPTVSWRNRDPETNAVSILEVRQYDDTRGGFPDTQRGAVMLYYANSPTIFPQVSAHELMRLKRIAAATPQDQSGEGEDGGSGQVVDETPTGPEVAPDELFGEDEQDGFPPPDDEPIEGAPDVRLEDLPSDLTDDGPAADDVIEGLPGDGENGIGGEVIEGLPENGDGFPELPPGNS